MSLPVYFNFLRLISVLELLLLDKLLTRLNHCFTHARYHLAFPTRRVRARNIWGSDLTTLPVDIFEPLAALKHL